MKFDKIPNFIFFGGGQTLTEFVRRLKGWDQDVFVVLSQRHADENMATDQAPQTLQQFCEAEIIPYYISQDVNTDEKMLKKIKQGTVGVSLGAAWIFKGPFIKRFDGRLLNVHGMRLPQNRGGGGFSWTILQGDRTGGCTIHQVEPGIDTGAIVKQRKFSYSNQCRIPADYHKEYVREAGFLWEEFLQEIKQDKDFVLTPQKEEESTYWPRLNSQIHGFIDWSWPVSAIERFICAFDEPYTGASSFLDNKRVYFKNCRLDQSFKEIVHPFQNGIVYRKIKEAIFVAVEGGGIAIGKVINEKGKSIFEEIKVGDRFYTPQKFLEQARLTRVEYTPEGLKKMSKK